MGWQEAIVLIGRAKLSLNAITNHLHVKSGAVSWCGWQQGQQRANLLGSGLINWTESLWVQLCIHCHAKQIRLVLEKFTSCAWQEVLCGCT